MTAKTFVTIHQLAQRLGLPAAWLTEEANAGRVPSLRIGRRIMFNLQLVEQVLIKRSSETDENVTSTEVRRTSVPTVVSDFDDPFGSGSGRKRIASIREAKGSSRG